MEAGYRRATKLAGLEASSERVAFVHTDGAEMPSVIEWILAQRLRPTAGIVFYSTAMFDAKRMLLERGIRCPEDISLITKSHEAEPADAAFLETDAFELGQIAVETLLARAAGKRRAGQRVVVASHLRRGPTVGVAPSPGVLSGKAGQQDT